MVQIRPGRGNFLSHEKWNPESDIFYEELLNTGPRFRDALTKFLDLRRGQRPSYRTFKKIFGRRDEALRNYAAGALAPKDVYTRIASELNVKEEITPENTMVRGQYVSQVVAYSLDLNSMQYEAGIQKIIGDLEVYSKSSSSPATNNSPNRQWIRDFLFRAHGRIPMPLFQRYEQGVIDVIEARMNMHITREDLMKAFNGPVETLEDRLTRISIIQATRNRPTEYSYKNGYTPDYGVGEFMLHPMFGIGQVKAKTPIYNSRVPVQSFRLDVEFGNGYQKLICSPKQTIEHH